MMWCAWPLSAPHWAPACLNQNSSNKSWKNINVSGTGLPWLFPHIYFIDIDILKWHEITCFPWSPKGKFEDGWNTPSEKGPTIPIFPTCRHSTRTPTSSHGGRPKVRSSYLGFADRPKLDFKWWMVDWWQLRSDFHWFPFYPYHPYLSWNQPTSKDSNSAKDGLSLDVFSFSPSVPALGNYAKDEKAPSGKRKRYIDKEKF